MPKRARLLQPLTSEQKELVATYVPYVYAISKSKKIFRYNQYHDTLSDGLLGLCEAAATYQPSKGSTFKSWAYQCVVSRIHTERTRAKSTYRKPPKGLKSLSAVKPTVLNTLMDSHTPDPLKSVLSNEVVHRIRVLIADLPAKERRVLELMIIHDLNTKEIATNLKWTRGYIQEIVARAKKKLYHQLHKEFEE